MKESINLPESRMNQIFGRKYIHNCVWVPWIVLTILLIATRLEETMRLIAWGIVCIIVVINIGYILYCMSKYMILNMKKRNTNH